VDIPRIEVPVVFLQAVSIIRLPVFSSRASRALSRHPPASG
jgi:hypothetical protein